MPRTTRPPLRHLRCLDAEVESSCIALEACEYWIALDEQAPGIMHHTGTLDVGPSQGPKAEWIQQLADFAETFPDDFELHTPETIRQALPEVRIPKSCAAIYGRSGGTVNVAAAEHALSALAERAGAAMYRNSVITGWSDEGSHFRIKVAAQPGSAQRTSGDVDVEEDVILEAEQVILADPTHPDLVLSAFGLSVAAEGVAHNLLLTAPPSAALQHALPASRLLLEEQRDSESGLVTQAESVLCLAVRDRLGACVSGSPAVDCSPAVSSGNGAEDGPHSTHHAERRERDWEGDVYRRCGEFARALELGPIVPGPRTYMSTRFPDGRPGVGWHPGFEKGRMVVALSSASLQLYGNSGWQTGLLTGSACCSLVQHLGGIPLLAKEFSLDREQCGAKAVPMQHDTWKELNALVQASTSI